MSPAWAPAYCRCRSGLCPEAAGRRPVELCRVSCVKLETETRYAYRYGAPAPAPALDVPSLTVGDLMQFMELYLGAAWFNVQCTFLVSILIHLSPMEVCTVCTAGLNTHPTVCKNQSNSLQPCRFNIPAACQPSSIKATNPSSAVATVQGRNYQYQSRLLYVCPTFEAKQRAQPLL
jgi:hypothetical protein